MNNANLASLLFSEKSLFDVLETYQKAFSKPLRNTYIFSIVFLSAYFYLIGFFGETIHLNVIQNATNHLVDFALVLVSTAFGFAIAGFTIFSGSLRPETVEKLIQVEYKKSGINVLSFIFAMFAYALVALFCVFVTSFGFKLLLSDFSLTSKLLEKLEFLSVFHLLNIIFFSFFSAQIIVVLYTLWSLIWNLHQTLLLVSAASLVETKSNNISEKNPTS